MTNKHIDDFLGNKKGQENFENNRLFNSLADESISLNNNRYTLKISIKDCNDFSLIEDNDASVATAVSSPQKRSTKYGFQKINSHDELLMSLFSNNQDKPKSNHQYKDNFKSLPVVSRKDQISHYTALLEKEQKNNRILLKELFRSEKRNQQLVEEAASLLHKIPVSENSFNKPIYYTN